MAGAIVVFAPSFVVLWLGSSYSEVARVAQILAVAAAATVVAVPWHFYAMGRGWQGIVVAASMTSLVLNVAGSLALTPSLGPQGAALGSLVGAVGATAMVYRMLSKRDKPTSLGRLWRPLMVILVASVASSLTMPTLDSWWVLLTAGAAWTIACVALLNLSRSLPGRARLRGRRLRFELDT